MFHLVIVGISLFLLLPLFLVLVLVPLLSLPEYTTTVIGNMFISALFGCSGRCWHKDLPPAQWWIVIGNITKNLSKSKS
jgi:hypothetical protein